jgi:hypothetical protein
MQLSDMSRHFELLDEVAMLRELVVQKLLQLTCSSHADHMQLLVHAHVTLS